MKGITESTIEFIRFLAGEYENSLESGLAAPYLETGLEDRMLLDNLISRMESDRPSAILANKDIDLLRNVMATHQQDMESGYGSLWKDAPEEENDYMDVILAEIQSALDAHNKIWLEYKGYSDTYQVIPYLSTYQTCPNLYMGLMSYDTDFGGMDHFTDVTVNLRKLPYLHAAIDINNNGAQMLDFLQKNAFGELTGRQIPSGYCVFPVFKFNEDKLRQIDPAGFAEYAKLHGKQIPSLETQLKDAKNKAQPTERQGRGEAEREL